MMTILRCVRPGDLKVSGYRAQIYRAQITRRGTAQITRRGTAQITRRGSRRPLGLRGTLVVITLVLIGLAQPQPEAAGRVVSFRLADGRMVSGLWMEAQERPAPAVVLVPMLGPPRDEWQVTAQRLAEVNINALAIDLPGSALPGNPAELARWHEAITAAIAYLAGHPADVRPGAIGVAGASLGANLALVAGAATPAVASLALVSPSLDYRGVRVDSLLSQYGGRPALLMASIHDPYAARSVRTLAQDASGPREVRWSSIAAHGTVLLSRDPELVEALVEWFQRTLGVH
jgi:dienelactone hydrolase